MTLGQLHQLPAFRKALGRLRAQLRAEKINLHSVSIEAQEVIDRVNHLITAEDILRKGGAAFALRSRTMGCHSPAVAIWQALIRGPGLALVPFHGWRGLVLAEVRRILGQSAV